MYSVLFSVYIVLHVRFKNLQTPPGLLSTKITLRSKTSLLFVVFCLFILLDLPANVFIYFFFFFFSILKQISNSDETHKNEGVISLGVSCCSF